MIFPLLVKHKTFLKNAITTEYANFCNENAIKKKKSIGKKKVAGKNTTKPRKNPPKSGKKRAAVTNVSIGTKLSISDASKVRNNFPMTMPGIPFASKSAKRTAAGKKSAPVVIDLTQTGKLLSDAKSVQTKSKEVNSINIREKQKDVVIPRKKKPHLSSGYLAAFDLPKKSNND